MPSVYLETFGCQMNEADSRYVAGRAAAAGYTIAADAEGASIVVLNTCTVRDNAEQRAYGRMQHFRALKNADPAPQARGDGLPGRAGSRSHAERSLPMSTPSSEPSELGRLGDALVAWRDDFGDEDAFDPALLREPLGGSADCVADAFTPSALVRDRSARLFVLLHVLHRAVRARAASITALGDDPRRSARRPSRRGAREIMLVGQTVNAYRDPANGADFADLARRGRGDRRAGADRFCHLASQGLHREVGAHDGIAPQTESALSPPGAVRFQRDAAPDEPQIHGGAVSREGRDVPRAIAPSGRSPPI